MLFSSWAQCVRVANPLCAWCHVGLTVAEVVPMQGTVAVISSVVHSIQYGSVRYPSYFSRSARCLATGWQVLFACQLCTMGWLYVYMADTPVGLPTWGIELVALAAGQVC